MLQSTRPQWQKKAAHQLWLMLPAEYEAPEIAATLLRNGLAVIGSEAFMVNGKAPHAARISLGAARSRAELTHALQILVTTLRQPAPIRRIV
jgi:DNA-binding transcriptional MocR family regulator